MASQAQSLRRSAPQAALRLFGQVSQGGEPALERDQVALMLKPLFSSSDPAVLQLVTDAYTDCVLGKIRPPDPPLAHSFVVPGGGYYRSMALGHDVCAGPAFDPARAAGDDSRSLSELLGFPAAMEQREAGFHAWDDCELHGAVTTRPGSREASSGRRFRRIRRPRCLPGAWSAFINAIAIENCLRAGLAPLEEFHEWYWRERDVTGCRSDRRGLL